jgi:oligogalacturonide lyase
MKTLHFVAVLSACALLSGSGLAQAQTKLVTGSQTPMPAAEWIDQDTGHRVVRLTPMDGNNNSFYFPGGLGRQGRADGVLPF